MEIMELKKLASLHENGSQSEVNIEGCWSVKDRKDYTVKSTYRDMFLIINMLDDYVKMLTAPGLEGRRNEPYYCYMVEQFKRISESLSSQLEIDKEKMYKNVRNEAIRTASVKMRLCS